MTHPTPVFSSHSDVLAIFQAELARTAPAPVLPQASPVLRPRFANYYQALIRLPRRARRALQRKWRCSLAAIALLLALGQAPALAATLTVTSAVAPDINPDGSCSLIEAIENANANAPTHADCPSGSGADTIVLPAASTQTLTRVHNSTYGPTGLPVIGSDITIEGNGSSIKRNNGPQFRILAVNGYGDLTLNETTVSRGAVVDYLTTNYLNDSGGGITVDFGGTLTLTNSTVSGNSAYDRGGGVYNRGTVTLTNSTVSGNTAASFEKNNSGGGVYNRGTVTLTNSTVSGNRADSSLGSTRGGGVFNSGTVTVTSSTVFGNSAGFGGGVSNSGTVTVTKSTFSGNSAESGGGVSNSGTLTVTNSTVSGNRANCCNGGVHNVDVVNAPSPHPHRPGGRCRCAGSRGGRPAAGLGAPRSRCRWDGSWPTVGSAPGSRRRPAGCKDAPPR